MIITTTNEIAGKNVEVLGVVKGSMIQSKNMFRDIGSALKQIVGGELKAYSDMINEARAIATKRMVAEAEAMGADGIVAMRYASSTVMAGAAEVLAYGTAVRFTS
jgi:uncharacterized protein YbjQ (UPF0145 family)